MSKTPNQLTLVLPLAVLLVLFWWTSFYGLNFGVHWDELRAKFDSIQTSVKTGIFMQSVGEADGFSYNYGGVNYLLTWAGFVPEIAGYLVHGPLTREALSEAIDPIIYSPAIRLRVRAIFVIVSSLSIVWLFCLCLVLGRGHLEAFLAAAILSLSWEVAYHSRWIAPDAIMMQFGVLAFLCIGVGLKRQAPAWFYRGAVVVGLAAGTKYPGVLILPFLLVAAGYTKWQQRRSFIQCCKHGVAVAATAALTFVATTPGAVLDPFRFFSQVREQQVIYATGWYGYTVQPGWHHVLEMVKYFSLQVFSHYWQISIVLAVFSLLGLFLLLFEFRLPALLMGGFCFVYLAFFSQQAAMMVRNLLVVIPFLALASARGVTVAAERLGPKGMRILYACVAVVLFMNLGWEVYAADQINGRGNWDRFLRKFEAYVQQSEGDMFLVSAELLRDLRKLPNRLPANIVTDSSRDYTKVAFLQAEGAEWFWEKWPGYRWGLYEKNFGALEVNLEAYPTFIGNQRILVILREHLRELPMTVNDLMVPRLTLSKSEVVAGSDSYVLKIKDMPNAQVILNYSFDGGPPEESAELLDFKGEKRMDVGPEMRKGTYRILAFYREGEPFWHNVDEAVVVK